MTPQIIAHRGASYLAPENTLTAFKKAMEIGADGVEMDVQQTIDAGLVIHHDYMIDLHTDISGKIYDMTMGDLKELDFGSWKDAIYQDEKIATLQEAMELCRQMPGMHRASGAEIHHEQRPGLCAPGAGSAAADRDGRTGDPCFLQPRAAAAGKAVDARIAGRCAGIR